MERYFRVRKSGLLRTGISTIDDYRGKVFKFRWGGPSRYMTNANHGHWRWNATWLEPVAEQLEFWEDEDFV